MYVALRQLPQRTFALTLVVRGRNSGSDLVGLVRRGVRAADPGVPADVELLATSAARGTAERRFTTSVLSLFGLLALALAAIGVYGALAFAVARRTREMAVRAALGADRADLLRLVLGSGARVIAAGTVAGLVAAWFLTRLLRSMLFEVEPGDPKVLAVATATIAVVALLAALVPARAATRVEPMHVLKSE
jgi:ABC-type antimicrobial peptide transport system permease subunit